jgi:single-strand DNA-binding protein
MTHRGRLQRISLQGCRAIREKGSKVYVEGQLATRKWQDQNGNDRYSTEVVLQGFNATATMLDSARGSGYQPGGNGADDFGHDPDRATGRSTQSRPAPNYSRAMDDDIPF